MLSEKKTLPQIVHVYLFSLSSVCMNDMISISCQVPFLLRKQKKKQGPSPRIELGPTAPKAIILPLNYEGLIEFTLKRNDNI